MSPQQISTWAARTAPASHFATPRLLLPCQQSTCIRPLHAQNPPRVKYSSALWTITTTWKKKVQFGGQGRQGDRDVKSGRQLGGQGHRLHGRTAAGEAAAQAFLSPRCALPRRQGAWLPLRSQQERNVSVQQGSSISRFPPGDRSCMSAHHAFGSLPTGHFCGTHRGPCDFPTQAFER